MTFNLELPAQIKGWKICSLDHLTLKSFFCKMKTVEQLSRLLSPVIISATIIISFVLCVIKSQDADDADATPDSYQILRNSILSCQYQTSLMASVVVALPMIVEIGLDGASIGAKDLSAKVSWMTRIGLVVFVSLPRLLLFLGVLPSDSVVTGHFCAITFTNVATSGCIGIFLCLDRDQKLEIGPICAATAVFTLVGSHALLKDQLKNYSTHGPKIPIFLTIAYVQLAYVFGKLLFDRITSRPQKLQSSVSNLIYFIGLCSILIGNVAIDSYFETYTNLCVSLHNYMAAVFLVIIMTLPGLLIRLECTELSQKMAGKDTFIRYISHEIRTPLNTVFLGMRYTKEELERIAPLVPEYIEPIIETVAEVNECCDVALTILNDMLTFDKLEEGKMTLDLKDTDLERFVRDTVNPFQILARGKDITVDVKMVNHTTGWPQSFLLRIDQHKMSQVLRNLISNAVKFTPHHGNITVSASLVEVSLKSNSKSNSDAVGTAPAMNAKTNYFPLLPRFSYIQKSSIMTKKCSSQSLEGGLVLKPVPKGEVLVNYLRIEVTDSGPGISKENQKKLFGQYVQFHAGKLQQGNGSGLGLWISKGITELHGGKYMTINLIRCLNFTDACVPCLTIYPVTHIASLHAGCIGAHSNGEGTGSTFYFELPVFSIDKSDKPDNPSGKLFSRSPSYQASSIMMHPNGSGLNPSVSLSDLVSLGHKIRGRGGSSDLLYDADACASHCTSSKASVRSGDGLSSRGRDIRERERERDLLVTRHRSMTKSSFSVRTGLAALFDSHSCRVGVINSDCTDVDIEAAVSSSISASLSLSVAPSPVGPCLRVRDLIPDKEEIKNKLSVLVVDNR